MVAYLCLAIASHDYSQVDKIQASKHFLREKNVFAMIGEIIKNGVNPHMGRRIHKRASATLNFGVFPLPVLVELDLLHIGFPVNLSI